MRTSSFYQRVHYWSLMFSGAVLVVQKRYKARWIFDLFLHRASDVPKLLRTAKIEMLQMLVHTKLASFTQNVPQKAVS